MSPSKSAPTLPYRVLISKAIQELNESKGSSRSAIKKHITDSYEVNEKAFDDAIKKALKKGVEDGTFKQVKQSFKIGKKKVGDGLKYTRDMLSACLTGC